MPSDLGEAGDHLYRLLFENMREGVAFHRLVHDEDGRAVDYVIEDVSPRYETILNIPRERAVGQRASVLYGAGDPPYLEIYARVAMTGEPHRFQAYFPPMGRHFQISVFSPEKNRFATIFSDITEVKRAEEQLRTSESNLRRAQAVAHVGSWALDIPGDVLVWSDETYRMFGLPVGAPLDYDQFLLCVHPDDRQRVDAAWTAALRGEPYDIDHRIVVDGRTRWVNEKAELEFDDDGRPLGGIGTVLDITDRKAAQHWIDHINAVLRAIRNVNQLIVREKERDQLLQKACDLLIETRGYVTAWIGALNDNGSVHLAGQAGDDVPPVGKEGQILPCVKRALERGGICCFTPDDSTCVRCREADVCRGRSTLSVRLEHGGRVFGVLSVGVSPPFDKSREERSLLREVTGDIAYALSSIDHEHALDRARRALRVLSRSNHAMVRAVDEVWLLGEACRILVGDGGYRFAWVGLAREDGKLVAPVARAGVDKGFLDAVTVSWDDSEHGRGPSGTAIRTGRPCVARCIVTDPEPLPWRDQAIERGYGSCAALPLVVGERSIGVLTIFASEKDAFDHDELTLLGELALDLGFGISTLRERSERDGLTKQLLHAQRMEALGRLAGGVAHDFNNLLSVIISFTRFAFDELSEDDTRRDDLRQVLSAADRANRLTRQLLSFSQTRKVEPTHLDLNEAVLQLDKMLRRTLGENIELVSLADEKLWTTFIDPGQLDQVLLNLAVNASDAMPEGGTLTLETRNVSNGSPTAELDPGEYVMLKVTDTGVGMNDEVAARAFEPFFTTKGVKGTGLGLSTCFGIIKQAGGSITAESRPGGGTTITVFLPRVDAGPATPDRAIERTPEVAPGDGVVFVVEDQPVVLSAVMRILRNAGFVVLEATSAEEALAAIERLSTNVRLVISDVVLPNMSGYDLVARLRSRRPGARVLLMSGYLGDDRPSRAIMDDGVPFLPKPFTPEGLLRAVHDVLGT